MTTYTASGTETIVKQNSVLVQALKGSDKSCAFGALW